jgi:hypothetical protein
MALCQLVFVIATALAKPPFSASVEAEIAENHVALAPPSSSTSSSTSVRSTHSHRNAEQQNEEEELKQLRESTSTSSNLIQDQEHQKILQDNGT